MIYVYGAACFFEALTMALAIKGGRIFNILASVFAFAVICLQLSDLSGTLSAIGYIHAFIHAGVIFVNGVVTGLKRK